MKNKMNKSRYAKAGIAALCLLLCLAANAQLYITNTVFSTGQNALVFVDGHVTYAGDSLQQIIHNGTMEVRGNWYNTATRDTTVFADLSNGIVLLNGALQTFNGGRTRFPNLTLAGSDKKQQFSNIAVNQLLDLTDRELDVNGNIASILSNNIAAIKYDQGGYINTSVRNTGWLVRNMNNGTDYVFPLGNVAGAVFRFRPLIVKAQQNGSVYGQFQDYNPASNGYPASIKADNISNVNDDWYHALTTDATAGNTVNVQLPYNNVTDGQFTTMVKWDIVKREWQKLGSAGPILTSVYNTNDYMFNTLAPFAISNVSITPVHLGNEKNIPFFIPNVITPNGDNRNDRLVIDLKDPASVMDIVIFNRWNNVVYQNKKYNNTWDGKGLNSGTYFYVLRVTTQDGKTSEYRGYIMLLR